MPIKPNTMKPPPSSTNKAFNPNHWRGMAPKRVTPVSRCVRLPLTCWSRLWKAQRCVSAATAMSRLLNWMKRDQNESTWPTVWVWLSAGGGLFNLGLRMAEEQHHLHSSGYRVQSRCQHCPPTSPYQSQKFVFPFTWARHAALCNFFSLKSFADAG